MHYAVPTWLDLFRVAWCGCSPFSVKNTHAAKSPKSGELHLGCNQKRCGTQPMETQALSTVRSRFSCLLLYVMSFVVIHLVTQWKDSVKLSVTIAQKCVSAIGRTGVRNNACLYSDLHVNFVALWLLQYVALFCNVKEHVFFSALCWSVFLCIWITIRNNSNKLHHLVHSAFYFHPQSDFNLIIGVTQLQATVCPIWL